MKTTVQSLDVDHRFFDLRTVHGQSELLQVLRQAVLSRTPQINNAQKQHTPLNLFGQIAQISVGEIGQSLTNVVSLNPVKYPASKYPCTCLKFIGHRQRSKNTYAS